MNPLRLVLDTNIVLDLLHFRDAAAAPVLDALRAGSAVCFIDAACREELVRVLRYPQFGLTPAAAQQILAEYAAFARIAPAVETRAPALPRCRDADDQKFLELAQAARADLLVTKDKALLRLGRGRRLAAPAVGTPADALLRLRGR